MKEELLKILKDAQMIEERLIPIYMDHLSSAVFWTGLDEKKVFEIKVLLKKLADDSRRHKATVDDVIAKFNLK